MGGETQLGLEENLWKVILRKCSRITYAADRESTYPKIDSSHKADLRDLQVCILAFDTQYIATRFKLNSCSS
jgi:hypothetical protein